MSSTFRLIQRTLAMATSTLVRRCQRKSRLRDLGPWRSGGRYTALLHELRDERRPPRLMRCAESGAVVAVEVLVKCDQIAPVRVALHPLHPTEHRTSPVLAHEQPDQTPRKLGRHLSEPQLPPRARRVLHEEDLTVVPVELLQRLDDEVVEGEPHRTAPVRVAAEQPAPRLRRRVVHPPDLVPVHHEYVRVFGVPPRDGPQPVW